MGNHEYCVECGENDFHHGRPCDPAKVAAMQDSEKQHQKRREQHKVRSKKLIKLLRRFGLVVDRTSYYDTDEFGNLSVREYTENFEQKLEEIQEAVRNELGDGI